MWLCCRMSDRPRRQPKKPIRLRDSEESASHQHSSDEDYDAHPAAAAPSAAAGALATAAADGTAPGGGSAASAEAEAEAAAAMAVAATSGWRETYLNPRRADGRWLNIAKSNRKAGRWYGTCTVDGKAYKLPARTTPDQAAADVDR